MDVAAYLRTHSTIVFNRPRGLAALRSPGAAFRWRKSREAAARRLADNSEKFRTRAVPATERKMVAVPA